MFVRIHYVYSIFRSATYLAQNKDTRGIFHCEVTLQIPTKASLFHGDTLLVSSWLEFMVKVKITLRSASASPQYQVAIQQTTLRPDSDGVFLAGID